MKCENICHLQGGGHFQESICLVFSIYSWAWLLALSQTVTTHLVLIEELGVRHVAQRKSTCLKHTKPCVLSPALGHRLEHTEVSHLAMWGSIFQAEVPAGIRVLQW